MRALEIAQVLVPALLASVLCAQTLPTAESTATVVKQVHPAAIKSLADFSKLVTEQNYEPMGFKSATEVRSATLGQPLQVFKVWLNELKEYQPSSDPTKLLHGGDELIYPVLLEQQPRSSVTMAKVDGVWKSVAFGKPQLAKMIAAAREKTLPEAGSSEPQFVVQIPALNMVFIGYRSGGKLMLAPILDDPRFGFKAGVSMPATDVFNKIVPAAKGQPSDVPS